MISKQHPCPSGLQPPSISPDGKRVLLETNRRIELVNLADRSIRVIGHFEQAVWAPNGELVAAFGNGRLSLLDAWTFKKRKSLGRAFAERPAWSPDSRYILIGGPGCGPYFSSLSVVNVATGKRTEIKSSHCEVQAQGHLVISNDVYRKALETTLHEDEDREKSGRLTEFQ